MPFKPKHIDNGANDAETYAMWLREELWYHFMYHCIVLGYNIYTWNDSGFIIFLAWAHFCAIVVYAAARVSSIFSKIKIIIEHDVAMGEMVFDWNSRNQLGYVALRDG
jgi:hypothetical protein